MRPRIGVALLALASAPFAGTPAGAAATATVARPAYLNIVVTSSEQPGLEAPPRYRVEKVQPVAGDTTLSPEVSCSTVYQPTAAFEVTCTPVAEPDPLPLSNTVTVTGRQCVNAAVRAEIKGPFQNEAVTGRITCGENAQLGAGCTATASTPDLTAGGYSGLCQAPAPNGPLPIRCWVDLSRVHYDSWQVTCMGTDP
jgi:hypothetical protein